MAEADETPYFDALSAALRRAGVAAPVLVIDRARLGANIATVRAKLAGSGLATRIVVKSLPSPRLIETVAAGLETNRFMVFNAPMLGEIARARPQAPKAQPDVLMGKPLLAAAAAQFYDAHPGALAPQWLIDTPERLRDYAALTAARGLPLRANLEIDIGMHRGGFPTAQALAEALDLAASWPHVTVTGLMGYETHIAKVPDRARAYARAIKAYAECLAVLAAKLPGDPARFTLNSGGSLTFTLHAPSNDRNASPANEVSLGSALLKPTSFDHDSLRDHLPAVFIATPVLKALDRTLVPSLERLAGLFAMFDPDVARAFFVHGGNWLAAPVHPPGLEYSKLYGRSSNQELLTASRDVVLAPDDYVFLRPAQSEAVLLQFGDLLVVDGGEVVERWPTYPVSA